jgi:hypothetical protein
MKYSVRRSIKNQSLHLIFEEGTFDSLPEQVRNQGPWRHIKSGELHNLREDYMKAIVAHLYIVVEQSSSVFSAET